MRAFNPTRLRRKCIFPDMRRIPQHCIDKGTRPGASSGRVLDHQVIRMRVRGRYLNGTAYPGPAVRAVIAVLGVCGGGARDEAGEDGMDDGRTVLVIGLGLQACVAEVFDTGEAELLGEVNTAFVWGVRHGYREGDIF